MLLVLIDESGCPGFKISKSSSPFFTIAMVAFNDFVEAEKVGERISILKRQLNIKGELKFAKSHPNVRDEFFMKIAPCDFSVRALVVDKQKIYSPLLRCNTEKFYNYCLKSLMQYDDGLLNSAHVKIDGSGNRKFKRALRTYLSHYVDVGKISKLSFVDSRKDALIQLADMVVGAIARVNIQDKKYHDRWFNILKQNGRIDNVWFFE